MRSIDPCPKCGCEKTAQSRFSGDCGFSHPVGGACRRRSSYCLLNDNFLPHLPIAFRYGRRKAYNKLLLILIITFLSYTLKRNPKTDIRNKTIPKVIIRIISIRNIFAIIIFFTNILIFVSPTYY